MDINIQGYLDTIHSPWGQLFYQMLWHNLEVEGKEILDFGSGFGVTADALAKSNTVIAVEPNEGMIRNRFQNHEYKQIVGGIEKLKEMPEDSFDLIICHNVLEYVEERRAVLEEFHRLSRRNGMLSLVKHNRAGKIMHKAVFENNVSEAMDLIHGEDTVSANFGLIREYEMSDLQSYISGLYEIKNVYGLRMFFGLQQNEVKTEPDWLSNMFELECAVEEVPEFRNVAYFHHIILKNA